MDDRASFARRCAGRFLIGPVAALCLAVPVLASPGERPDEKSEAAKVAKKVEKALQKARKAAEEPVEADRRALREFHEEVMDYAELHAKQVARLGEPVAVDAQGYFAAQQALARSIQSKRDTARQGDIFAPAVEPIFRRLLAVEFRGPDGLPARKAVLEGNPGQEDDSVPIVVRVNGEYPIGTPRSTVPPSVLLTLPPLPACLRYQFVGRDLILVDSVAGLIVDFLPAAAPDLAIKRLP